MQGKCFNCSQEATGRYAVMSEPHEGPDDRLICNDCLSELEETDGVEVFESPVFMRGAGSKSIERAPSQETCETDELLKTLAHPIRREVIHHFESRGAKRSASLDDLAVHIDRRIPAKNHDQLRATLYQVHLPRLHSRGWLVFDTENASVTYEGRGEARSLMAEVMEIFDP